MSDDHFLSEFLVSRLPELGLDFETYGETMMFNFLKDCHGFVARIYSESEQHRGQ